MAGWPGNGAAVGLAGGLADGGGGLARSEVFYRAAAAMGHEVSEPVLLRKLRDSRWRFGPDGRLALRG